MAKSVAFARAPAKVIDGLLVDYTRTEPVKVYRGAIKQVAETMYDSCEPKGLFQFLLDVQDRADEMGWSSSILMIT